MLYLILVKPSMPNIKLLYAEPTSLSGTNVTLECVSKGGNLVPLLLWFNLNMTSSPLDASVSVVLENDDTYTVTSRLSVVTSEDEVFVCQSSLRDPPHIVQYTDYQYQVTFGRLSQFKSFFL